MLAQQVSLERDMARRGRERYERSRVEAAAHGDNMRTRSFKIVHGAAVEPLVAAIEKFVAMATEKRRGRRVRSAAFLSLIPPEAAAHVALAEMLGAVGKDRKHLYNTARSVGRAIEVEAYFAQRKLDAPGETSARLRELDRRATTGRHLNKITRLAMTRSASGGEYEEWPAHDRISTGLKMVELVVESTGLFEVYIHKAAGKKTTAMLRASPRLVTWLADVDLKLAAMSPTFLPMLVSPRDWTGLRDGGYWTDALLFPPRFVRGAHSGFQAAAKATDLRPHMEAVNAIQGTPWRINRAVLEVVRALSETGRPVAGLPDMEPEPIPTPPHDFHADPEAAQEWKRLAAQAYTDNAKVVTKRVQLLTSLAIASDFAKADRFFFPHQCDFRGRVYPIPDTLNPQGGDVQRGLLEFADGFPLQSNEGARWFEIHGANCWGVKGQFSRRQQWVAENATQILETAAAPLDETWWMEAKKPFQFLAWCFEYAAWQSSGFSLDFISRVPVAMDGSCNGLQHFSAMLHDPVGGASVNLLPAEEPHDVYAEVAEETIRRLELLRDDPGTDPEVVAACLWWLKYGIDRDMCKRPVMVLPYGATERTCFGYVLETLRKQTGFRPPPAASEVVPFARVLTKALWGAMQGKVAAAALVMEWLQKSTKKAQGPIKWTSPSGFPVVQNYLKDRKTQMKVVLFGRRFQPQTYIQTDETDSRKQVAGVAPNLIQSCDAGALALTVNMVSGEITQFAMIHDSFGCPAGQAPIMARALREAFSEVYAGRFLDQMWRETFPSQQTPPPFIGGLDLSLLPQSDYFFA